jgi:hypothetical protein
MMLLLLVSPRGIVELILGPLHVVKVRKRLIVDSELKGITILDDIEHMVGNRERELERSAKLLSFHDHRSVFEHPLLT